MNKRLRPLAGVAGLLLAGSLTLPAGAAPGVPLIDPFGVRFTPAPVRVAPMQGRPLRALRVQHLDSLSFSPDGRFLAFSRTVVLRRPKPGDHSDAESPTALGEVRVLDVRTRRVSTVLSTEQTRRAAVYSGLVSGMRWVDRRRLAASIFNGDDGVTVFTVDVLSRKVVDATWVDIGIPEPTPMHTKARERARTLFPNLDPALFDDYAWGYAHLVGDRGVLLQRPTTMAENRMFPGDVWFLDFRQRTARHLIAFKKPDAWVAGVVTVGESTLFLLSRLSTPRQARLFLYRDGRVEPLLELRADMASISPLLVTPKRAYFALRWETANLQAPTGDVPTPGLALCVFDGRTLQRSNDYPSLFDADIDPSGRLVAFAYRMKMADRLVMAELAR